MTIWLSVNFNLPATNELPQVRFVPEASLATLRAAAVRRRTGAPAHTPHRDASREPNVHAFYDDARATIYLDDRWTETSARDVSILVHELVHHLQNAADLSYACAAERERIAYAAQARWLDRSGTTLMDAFSIDPMTLLVRTRCLF